MTVRFGLLQWPKADSDGRVITVHTTMTSTFAVDHDEVVSWSEVNDDTPTSYEVWKGRTELACKDNTTFNSLL